MQFNTHRHDFYIFFIFFIWTKFGGLKKKEKKKKGIFDDRLSFQSFSACYVHTSVASNDARRRPPTEFVHLAFTKRKALSPRSIDSARSTHGSKKEGGGVYKITYDGLRESVQKISFFLNEEKFKKLPKFWAFIFLVAFVLFFSIYSFSRMTTSFFFSCFIACVDGKFLKATSGLVTSVHVWLSRQWWDIDREREREIDTG